MLRLRYFTEKTQRFVSVPIKNIDLVDLAWYPMKEDTAREPNPMGFANLEVRFTDGKRLTAKWELTQNDFLTKLVADLEKDNRIGTPADWLRLRGAEAYDRAPLTFLERGSFWET